MGLDISTAVVERCNERLKEAGAGEGSVAIAANISKDKDVLGGRTFDLVFVSPFQVHWFAQLLTSFMSFL